MVNDKIIVLVQRLKEKKKNLGSILIERAMGALVRAIFTSLNDMAMAQNEVHCIKLPGGGRVSIQPVEIWGAAAQFYTELYKAE